MSESVKRAIDNYLLKNESKNKPASRKNKKPELEVLRQLKSWLEAQGIYTFRVESQAVFSKSAGMYLYGQTVAGCPDLLGLNNQGIFVAVEVKAPGRRSALRDDQRAFLIRVIDRNGFAVVSDASDHLQKIYTSWLNSTCPMVRKQLLLNDLPKAKSTGANSKPLFED